MAAKVPPADLEATKKGKINQTVLEIEDRHLLVLLTAISSSLIRRDPKANTAKKETNLMQRNLSFLAIVLECRMTAAES